MQSYNKYITHKILGEEVTDTRRVRYLIFLRDVFLLTVTSFGGAQAHLTLFFNTFVTKRKYLTEKDLVELNSFCHILPGPASTQIITAIGFKLGGYRLAWLTLFVWILPTTLLMIFAAMSISWLQRHDISITFTRFIQPMAVAFVAWSAYKISSYSVQTKTSHFIFIIAAIASYFIRWPGIFPVLLILAGCATAIRFKKHPKEEKSGLSISWKSLLIYSSIFIGAAFIGHVTDLKIIRLFENFFRNGSIIFGGGHPLSALLYKEFVQFKDYLSAEEFLSGFALQQAFPGPIFCFTAFIGALSMREFGFWGEVGGGLVAAAGIFLPGTLLIFFMVNIWEKLKKYRAVKASLEGINAASAGIVTATALLLFTTLGEPSQMTFLNYGVFIATLLTLLLTKIPPPYIIIAGLSAGFIF
ncbi:chromate efflux transporter [Cytophagaceae bacterium ABcell3]|nr:chromate efflux transporter [Cytophagaceae bacterium ABcell3]